jgi:hypothetical protein
MMVCSAMSCMQRSALSCVAFLVQQVAPTRAHANTMLSCTKQSLYVPVT